MVRKMDKLIATYLVESPELSKIPIERIAEALADEQGLGLRGLPIKKTFIKDKQDLATEVVDIIEVCDGKGIIKLAFNLEHFDENILDIANMFNLIAGDAFGSKYVKYLRLIDVDLPTSLISKFPGPKYGLEQIRKIVGEDTKPLLGLILKPSLGLSLDEIRKIVHDAGMAGVHLIKDDEKFASTKYTRFEKKVEVIGATLKKIEKKTSKRVLYAANISGDLEGLKKRAKIVEDAGLGAVMLTIVTLGPGAVKYIASDKELDVAVYAHRAMHAAFTRIPDHSISIRVINKFTRIAGADFQHVGAVFGAHSARLAEIQIRLKYLLKKLNGSNMKPSVPVISAGIHPGNINANYSAVNTNDILFMVGRGAYFDKNTVGTGIKALRQAIDASVLEIPIEDAIKKYDELREAIRVFGFFEGRR